MTAIEAGAGAWRMPWHTAPEAGVSVLPVNAVRRMEEEGVARLRRQLVSLTTSPLLHYRTGWRCSFPKPTKCLNRR